MPEYALEDLARRVGGKLVGAKSGTISGVAAIQQAGPLDLSFFLPPDQSVVAKANRFEWLSKTRAGVVLLAPCCVKDCPVPAIVVDRPREAFAQLAHLWEESSFKPGVHPSAVIGSDCQIDASVALGAHCVIGDRVVLGKGCRIGTGAIVEDDCILGDDCSIHPRAIIRSKTRMGKACVVRSGAVLGESGFGYEQDAQKHWQRVPQLGAVVLGDGVDIGALSAIDRGALDDTVIGDGVKCDNLVQMGHNVVIGKHTLICGCVGIAGSTRVGTHCILGGGSQINGHLSIADHTVVAGASAVGRSIDKPGLYASFIMAEPHVRWKRILLGLHRLPELIREVRTLTRQVAALEKRK